MSVLAPFDLQEIEDEPRVLDVDLGAALGMAQPRNIRQTITANKAELDSYGQAHEARALVDRTDRGQVEVTTYWLNEPQALLLCMFARTPKAAEVRRMLIEAFMQWRRERLAGQHPPAVIQPDPRTRLAMLEARVAQLENRAPPQFLPIQAVKAGGFDRDAHYKWRILEGIRASGGEVTKTKLFKLLPHRFSAAQIDQWTGELVAAGQLAKRMEPRKNSFATVFVVRA